MTRAQLGKLVGTNVRTARGSCGLTQTALGAKAGVSSTFIFYVESGAKMPSLVTLKALADALGTTASELLKGV